MHFFSKDWETLEVNMDVAKSRAILEENLLKSAINLGIGSTSNWILSILPKLL